MLDYLIVGAGFFGSVFAHEVKKKGKSVRVIDKRGHIGGNSYTQQREGINVHLYGPHIFHTGDKVIWEYINRFAQFNNFVNCPVAVYKDELYNLPFNMNTFSKMWNIKTPKEARDIISRQIAQSGITEPMNLEEQALSLVGFDVYEKLIKGYTEKQWGADCKDLPAFIIRRLPLRFTYDNNYFNDRYQGIPDGGYTQIFEKLLDGIDVTLNCDFLSDKEHYLKSAKKVIYTGMIDQFFDYSLGELQYRSLHFDTVVLDTDNFQGNAVVNYTDKAVPYTRVVEHKHFERAQSPKTVVTYEYSAAWQKGGEPFYAVNDERNTALYKRYRELPAGNVVFGGRLGTYQYYDMDKVISEALKLAEAEL